MDFITSAARKMKAILSSKHRRGSMYTQMARAQAAGIVRMQDLSMPELSLNNRNKMNSNSTEFECNCTWTQHGNLKKLPLTATGFLG